MRVPRVVVVGLLSISVFAGSLALVCAPALGFVSHQYLSQITEANGSPFREPWGLTFDSGGNLLVTDAMAGAVDVFSSTDVFTGQFGAGVLVNDGFVQSVAVSDTTGDVYVGSRGVGGYGAIFVFKPESGGKYKLLQERRIGLPIFVTVNNSSGPHRGDVYVIFTNASSYNVIAVIKPNAEGELVEPGEELPQKLGFRFSGGAAIDKTTGKIYVPNPQGPGSNGFVNEYNSEDVYQGHLNAPPGGFGPTAVAVEESTGDLYVLDALTNAIDEFNAAGEFIGRFANTPAGPLSSPADIAVNASGDVYVSDVGTRAVDVFGPNVLVPEVTTGASSAVLRTSAKLEGTVNPEGKEVTSCQFEYGTSAAYGNTAPCATAPGSGSSSVPVSAEVSGLTPETTYHYRLVAGYSAATTYAGTDHTVTTLNVVPNLQTEAATNVERSGKPIVATLNGSLAPDGADTHYYFEYGETEAYGSVSPALPGADAGEAFKVEHAQTQIIGLKAYSTYHFRIVATNSFGTVRGGDVTFTTTAALPLAPVIGGVTASSVTQFTAALNGTLETSEGLVNYHFEYGTTTAYGSIAPVPDSYTPITGEMILVSQPVGGLQAGTTYHYRLVASSPGGTEVKGPDETFTTLPVPAPTVETGAASGVGVGAATLSGTIDPHSWDTTYLFQYGTSTSYGQSWPTVQVDMGALEGPQPVIVNVPNLLPSTTYHYRLVATNGGGTSYGPDMTFTTGEYPRQIIQEPVALRTLLVPSDEGVGPSSKHGKKSKQSKRHAKRKRKVRGKGDADRGRGTRGRPRMADLRRAGRGR